MLNVTDSALEHLASAMDNLENQGPPDRCFRIVPGKESQLGLAVDVPAVGDKVFAHEGQVVLALPQRFKDLDRTLDTKDGKLVLK